MTISSEKVPFTSTIKNVELLNRKTLVYGKKEKIKTQKVSREGRKWKEEKRVQNEITNA